MAATFYVSIHESPGDPRHMTLPPGTYDIGRDLSCAIVLKGLDVSRRHARLTVGDKFFIIEDLGSASGTRVGLERITQTRRFERLQTIHFGSAAITFDPQRIAGRESAEGAQQEGAEKESHITAMIDATDRGTLQMKGVNEKTSKRLEMLYDLPLQFAAEQDLAKLYSLILNRVIALISGAERGALLIIEPLTGKLSLQASLPADQSPISRTLVKRAALEKKGFIWQDHEELDPTLSIVNLKIRTGMYVPLLWKGKVVGVLCVDNQQRANAFREDDLQFLIFVAHYAASAVANQLLQESIEQNNRTLENLLGNFSPKLRGKLLQKSREGKLQPGGEKSDVTILMSDLRGFTRVSAELDAHAVVLMLNDYFSLLGDIIFQHDGTIDKFIGDAILAVFGSPEQDAKHAENAVSCAICMRRAMTEINDRRRADGLPLCEIGIGVHTGEVLHGFIGASERLEFTVIGDTVNKASRYCDGAKANEILLGPRTWETVKDIFPTAPCTIPTKHEGDMEAHLVVQS